VDDGAIRDELWTSRGRAQAAGADGADGFEPEEFGFGELGFDESEELEELDEVSAGFDVLSDDDPFDDSFDEPFEDAFAGVRLSVR
jgi:hypothetical protein